MPSTKHPNNLDYNHIAEGIYIGTNQCCQIHFDSTLLHKENIAADISLEENRIDVPFGVKFYVWMPVKNHTPPSPEQLEFGAAALQTLVAMKKNVYVHCKNGHGRAPTLVAAYLVRAKAMEPGKAETFLKTRRPSVHLNQSQQEALKLFSEKNSS